MGLLNIININDDREEQRPKNKAFAKRNNGYSVYESLEFGKKHKIQNESRLQFDIFRSYVR